MIPPSFAPAAGSTQVMLTDTRIALADASVPAGSVRLTVVNAGSVMHSLLVMRTSLAHDKIPPDPNDGARVEERGVVAASGQIPAGRSEQVVADLHPGTYVLLCNEPAHYAIGMHVALTVH